MIPEIWKGYLEMEGIRRTFGSVPEGLLFGMKARSPDRRFAVENLKTLAMGKIFEWEGGWQSMFGRIVSAPIELPPNFLSPISRASEFTGDCLME